MTSQITDIQMAPNGNLTFTVNGTGFDPQLLVRPIPQGRYQITIISREARLQGPQESLLAEQIQTRIPAIESILLSGDDTGFQLNLTSWQKLQPQILSNTPGKIVLTFLGNHQQRPPQSQVRPAPQSPPKAATQIKPPVQSQVTVKPSQSEMKPESPVSSQTKPMLLKETQPKPAVISAPVSPVPVVKSPDNKNTQAVAVAQTVTEPSQPAALLKSVSSLKSSPVQESTLSQPASVKPVKPAESHLVISSPSPVKVVSAAKREITPARVASISPQALERDWLPAPRPSPLSELPKRSQPDTALEALNFLSQRESAPQIIPSPPSASAEPQSPFPLRLQKTPAGYNPSTLLTESSGSAAQSSVLPVLGNEYSAFPEPSLQRVADDLRNGRLDNAEVSLQGFLAREPNSPQASFLLALIYLSPSNPVGSNSPDPSRKQKAQRLLETLHAHQPGIAVYQQLIGLAIEQDKLDTASSLLKEALRQFPENVRLWYLQGRLQEEGKHWEAAKSAYGKALALDGHHPEIHYRLALMHLKEDNWSACARSLNLALAIAPDDARYLKLMGYLMEKQGTPMAAASYYKAALQSDVMLYYGRLLQRQKRTTEALSFYQAVESVADNDPDLLLSLGTLYTEAKATQRVQSVLKRLIQLVPNPQDPRHSQAKAMLKQLKN